MIRDIVYLIASLFMFGLAYLVINIVISALQMIFVIDDAIVLAVYFLWTIVPIIYYIGKIREYFEARGVTRLEE